MSSQNESQGQLGAVVSWQVPSEVSLFDLRKALTSAGFDAQDMAGDMAPRNALLRSLREMKTGRVIRQLRREGDKLYFQFTSEHLQKYEVTYDKEAELYIDVNTGVVWCSVPQLQAEATKLVSEHMSKRLTTDLTRMVQRIYESRRADLIPIRRQGGVYFVPDMHREVVAKTKQLLEAIGGKLDSLSVRLGCADTSASVADHLSEYMKELIGEFKESCAELNKDSRENVKTARQGRVKEMRQKLSCYSTLLQSYSSVIETQIAEAEKVMLANLLRAGEPKEEKPVEPAAKPVQQSWVPLTERITPGQSVPLDTPLQGVGE